jgi:hypothetical protein
LRSAGFEATTAAVDRPGMLKVLLGATQVRVRSASLRGQAGEYVMCVAAEDEVVVDLVGDDQEVALDGQAA